MHDNIILRHIARQPNFSDAQAASITTLPKTAMDDAYSRICQWQGYTPTPLYSLADSAQQYGINALYYKDEAPRFGLESFKALGGAYAIDCLLEQHLATGGNKADFTAASATDGNHGRSIAWGAQRAGCCAKIFVHRSVSEERIAAIAQYGADVIRIDGNYDDSVRACSEQSAANNWRVISDTSWQGYTDTPRLVMAGYTVLLRETLEQIKQLNGSAPTHVILQAGVGAFAAAMVAALLQHSDTLPRIIIAETAYADCLLQSAAADRIVHTPIEQETVMAGLSCGEPSLLAWQILAAAASDFVAISDSPIGGMMRTLADAKIIAGECAAAGLAVVAATQDSHWRETLGLTEQSSVLLFGSEGATDKENYQRLIDIDKH